MKPELAYIDDDQLNLECIKSVLEEEFYVSTFLRPQDFLEKLGNHSYDCILTDINMPEMDGFALYEKIIELPHFNGCPILFITSDDSDTARIKSLTLGAVDYINRVINPEEMIVRIKSKIQFFEKHRSIIEFTNLKVNLTLLKAYLNHQELSLTFIEFKILCLVLRNYPDVVTKDQIIKQVWRTDHVLDATIYTHVSNLNGKLSDWDYEINGLKSRGIQLMKKEKL